MARSVPLLRPSEAGIAAGIGETGIGVTVVLLRSAPASGRQGVAVRAINLTNRSTYVRIAAGTPSNGATSNGGQRVAGRLGA
jgi:hypothetical protein